MYTHDEISTITTELFEGTLKWETEVPKPILECDDFRNACVSLVGSYNYGTAIEGSDLDFKIIYYPTFKEFYSNSFPVTHYTSEKFDISLHPVHKYVEQMFKGNINFFEILFGTHVRYDRYFGYFVDELRLLMKSNTKVMCKSVYMTVVNRMRNMSKNGYDGKNASTIIRNLVFLTDLLDTGSICIKPSHRYSLSIKGLKSGSLGEPVFQGLYDDLHNRVVTEVFNGADPSDKTVEIQYSDVILDMDQTDTDRYLLMKEDVLDGIRFYCHSKIKGEF